MTPYILFKKLLKIYGPQRWWPLFVTDPDISLYSLQHSLTYGISYADLKKFKLKFRDPYFEIALGAILTQNVSWVNVTQSIQALFQAQALTPTAIAALNHKRLEKILVPTRFYTEKAKNVKRFSQWLIHEYRGDILKLAQESRYEIRKKLMQQRGIGKETADSIMLYALNLPVFMIDIYTIRLCRKIGVQFKEYDEVQDYFEANLAKTPVGMTKVEFFKEFHALIVRSGQDKHSLV